MLADLIAERVRFPGPSGRLAGELTYPIASTCVACLIVNPHPYMGGRMDNNVVARLAATLPERGAVTLRFDYAGVGDSDVDADRPVDVARSMSVFWETGHAPEDDGWAEDARAALRWLDAQVRSPVVVIGYSFGAHVAAQIADARVGGLVLLSPTLAQHDLSRVQDVTCPKLVVYSDADFATPAQSTERWIQTLPEPKQAVRFGGAEHFFRGVEHELVHTIRDFLDQWCVRMEATA